MTGPGPTDEQAGPTEPGNGGLFERSAEFPARHRSW
jgi:hypothetical protein